MSRTASGKAYPYQNSNTPYLHHSDGVAVTGTLTVDLKIGHPNFVVFPAIVGGHAAVLADKLSVAWRKGADDGTFILSVDADGAAAVVPYNISFIAVEGTVVSL